MFKDLFNIIVKEVKELVRDPKILLGMIIVPLIMFPLMGFAIQTSMETAEESMREILVVVLNLDIDGNVSQNLKDFLKIQNVTVDEINTMNLDEAVAYAQESNATALIVIPQGFSDNVTRHLKAELNVYTVFRGGGITESASFSMVNVLDVEVVPKSREFVETHRSGLPSTENPSWRWS